MSSEAGEGEICKVRCLGKVITDLKPEDIDLNKVHCSHVQLQSIPVVVCFFFVSHEIKDDARTVPFYRSIDFQASHYALYQCKGKLLLMLGTKGKPIFALDA